MILSESDSLCPLLQTMYPVVHKKGVFGSFSYKKAPVRNITVNEFWSSLGVSGS